MSDATRIISTAADLLDIATVDLPVVNAPLVAKFTFGLDRDNHTGTQAIATVTGLQTRLDALPALAVENLIGTTSGGITTSLVNDGEHVALDVGGIVLDSSTGGIDCGVIKSAQYDFTSTTIFNYTTDTAAAHRTAMGLGTGDNVQFAAITGTTGTFSGILSSSNATAATNSTNGSVRLAGGLSIASGGAWINGTTSIVGVFESTLIRSGFYVQANTEYLFGAGGIADISFRKNAAGVVEVSNGTNTAGNLRDMTLRNLTASGTVTGKSFIEGVTDRGTVGSTATIVISTGSVVTATLTDSTPCTFTMPTAAAGLSFILHLKQAPTTATTAAFTDVLWAGEVAPTITATAGRVDILSFVTTRDAAGTGWLWAGSAIQNITLP